MMSLKYESRAEIQEILLKLLSNLLDIPSSALDAGRNFSEYGLDSLSLTEYSSKISKYFGVSITPIIFYDAPNIITLSQCLIERYNKDLPASPLKHAIRKTGENNYQKSCSSFCENIAIVGMNCSFPGAKNLRMFWKNLIEGNDPISEIPKDRWNWKKYYGENSQKGNVSDIKFGGFVDDIDKFDAEFFDVSFEEAEFMDPQQRLFIESAWKTIEDAGYKASDLSGDKIGVFVGVGNIEYNETILKAKKLKIEGSYSLGIASHFIANRVSYFFNFHGPSEVVDTACSSSSVAVNRAVKAIQIGECEAAIAGGVSLILSPEVHVSFTMAGGLSKDGRCKVFDKKADGFGRAEGVGALFLKPLKQAEADGDHIYGIIKGSAVNHGGHASALHAPNPNAQTDLLVQVYEETRIDPATVSYIEVSAVGTQLGDPIEVNALKRAFTKLYESWKRPAPETSLHCGLGSVSSNIGHMHRAAGIAAIIKILLSMKYGQIPATMHFSELNPYINLENSPFYIVSETKSWARLSGPRRAGVSSFGIGGTNVHTILEEYEDLRGKMSSPKNEWLIVLSAKKKDVLRVYVKEIIEFLEDELVEKKNEEDHSAFLTDMAYTLQVGREEMEERIAVIVRSREELTTKLRSYYEGEGGIEGLWSGRVKKKKDRKKTEENRLIIEEGDLRKGAELWVKGTILEWQLLHRDCAARRISLPAYPFTRKRHWISE